MRDDKDRAALRLDLGNSTHALLLEGDVSHGKRLVDEQDVGFHLRRHGESQSEPHPGTIGPDRTVDEVLKFGKLDDSLELLLEFLAGHAGDQAQQKYVFPTGQVGRQPGPDIENGADPSMRFDPAGIGQADAADQAQQR
ncbi:hypothetical protein D3C87_1624110 [compost metagenome]